MTARPFLASFLLLTVVGAGCHGHPIREQLNGTWVSDIMTVTIDFDRGTYSGIALGEQFSEPLVLISEDGNVVVFKAGANTIVCQIQHANRLLLTKQGPLGGIPVLLQRAQK